LATFHYKAYTAQGVVTAGTIVAECTDAAIDALYGSGLTPFETYGSSDDVADRSNQISSVSHKAVVPIWKRELIESNHFSLKELTAFTAEIATLINSALPLDAAFRIIAGPGAAPKTIRLANGLLKDVLAGLQLSEAMAQRPDIFPSDYRAILGAGEAGGVTGQVLKQISELLARRLEIRGKILVCPGLSHDPDTDVAGLGRRHRIRADSQYFTYLYRRGPSASRHLEHIFGSAGKLDSVVLVLGVGVTTSVVLWSRAKQNAEIMTGVDRLKCSLPVVGKLIQAREAGGFARALGTLLGARVPLMSAMHTARALVTNRYLNTLYASAINRVPEGTPLHRAFEGTGLLPATSLAWAVGEESGQLGSMLMQVATVIEADLQRHIERMVGLLTPILTLAVGGSVGALIMHVMSAVLSINNLAFQ
jgi:general secretion pathway protein F